MLSLDLLLPRGPAGVAAAMFVFVVFLFLFKTRKYDPKGKTPVPPGANLPIVGCLPTIAESWPLLPDFILNMNNQMGGKTWCAPVINCGLLGTAMFSISSESAVRHMLKDNFDNYEKGANTRSALGEFLGDGIFSTDGALWKNHRKIASKMFSNNLMRQGTVVAIRQLRTMVKVLRARTSAAAAAKQSKPAVVDMQDMFFRLTIDVFAEIAFGAVLNSLERENVHPFAACFDEVQKFSQKRFKDPLWRLSRFFQCTEAERAIRRGVKTMDEFAFDVIKQQRRAADSGENLGPDLLSRFLDRTQTAAATSKEDDISSKPPSNRELRDIVMNFMIAGRDTTACALSWTMYELGRHPEALKKVIEECVRVCGPGTDEVRDEAYDYDKIADLKYTHAVAMEVLRLHPSVPVDIKFAINDDTLPDGTFVPKGCCVAYSPYAMGRSKELWGDDATVFRPERFLGEKEPSEYKYPTFNAGYRLCLGKPLALLEIKLALAILLPRFDFKIANDHPGTYESTLVLPMKPGLEMFVTSN